MMKKIFASLLLLAVLGSCTKKLSPDKLYVKTLKAKAGITTEPLVRIYTDSGQIFVKLYNQTPNHRDNFLKLVKNHTFDSLLFHRVIKGFMIQGGDPTSKHAKPGALLGEGEVGYTIPAEFNKMLLHKRGALAAAREGDDVNPTKASSGCQFYLVQGRIFKNQELDRIEMQNNYKFSDSARKIYTTVGGTPFLDGSYTVFGEIIEGFDVLDKIASVPKDKNDRPIGNVRMRMVIVQ